MFPLVTLFGKEIGTYSLCVIAGVLALMLCTWLLARRRGLVPEDEVVVMLVALAGMVVGGSLLYGATNASLVAKILGSYEAYDGFVPWAMDLAACFGGSVFYGGLAGAVVAGSLSSVRAAGASSSIWTSSRWASRCSMLSAGWGAFWAGAAMAWSGQGAWCTRTIPSGLPTACRAFPSSWWRPAWSWCCFLSCWGFSCEVGAGANSWRAGRLPMRRRASCWSF